MSLAFAAEKELLAMKPPKSLKLPRAITYAASLYTIGVPPSLIGLGRGLRRVEKELGGETLEYLLKTLPLLNHDMEYDMRFYVPEVVMSYVKDEKAIQLLKEDISIVRDFLGGNTPEPSEEYVEVAKILGECKKVSALETVMTKLHAGGKFGQGGGYKVSVGSVLHPMDEKHYIEWIELLTNDGKAYRQFLNPGDEPVAIFKVDNPGVSAREHCNLHGVWKAGK
jgi:desulfoferrodoxin-like iron-binding protein